MYLIRYGENVRWTNTEYACGTRLGNSVTCPVVDRSQSRLNGHQGMHTGYLQDNERMITRQNAREPDKPHTHRTSNVHPPDIFIGWRPFEVLNMSRTCKRIGLTKHYLTRNTFEQSQTDRRLFCPLRVR